MKFSWYSLYLDTETSWSFWWWTRRRRRSPWGRSGRSRTKRTPDVRRSSGTRLQNCDETVQRQNRQQVHRRSVALPDARSKWLREESSRDWNIQASKLKKMKKPVGQKSCCGISSKLKKRKRQVSSRRKKSKWKESSFQVNFQERKESIFWSRKMEPGNSINVHVSDVCSLIKFKLMKVSRMFPNFVLWSSSRRRNFHKSIGSNLPSLARAQTISS